MDKINTYQISQTDERLIAFVSNYADSGESVYHIAAKIGHSTGRHLSFLQELYDQYVHSSLYDSFSISDFVFITLFNSFSQSEISLYII